MARAFLLAAVLLLTASFSQAVLPGRRAQGAAPTDGHWWLAASLDERLGYAVGRLACNGDMARDGAADVPIGALSDTVAGFYRRHPGRLNVPVVAVVAKLERQWKAAKTYRWLRPSQVAMYDGDDWRQKTPVVRAAIIRGFIDCQAAEQGVHVSVPVAELVRRVSIWYGVHPVGDWIVDPATEHDKLYRVIVDMEKHVPAPRVVPGQPNGHWWLAVGATQRKGFAIGRAECLGMLHHHGLLISRSAFTAAVTDYYRRHPERIYLPVSVVFDLLDWPNAIRVRLPRTVLDGDGWASAPIGERMAIVRGFVACQGEEEGVQISVPVLTAVSRVSRWYGVDPMGGGMVDPATEEDPLYLAMLLAEQPRRN